jgi:uncharacterized protein YktA (UPF0223 family)
MAKLVAMKGRNGKVYNVSRLKADDLLKRNKGFSEVNPSKKKEDKTVKATKEDKQAGQRATK